MAGGAVAAFLIAMINLITHLAFAGTLSFAPADASLFVGGFRIVVVPLVGALLIGIMARWGSEAIRGHGIPEVIDRILHGDSRIPAKLTVLKPLSAAIAIGTGGPFGAEGPIIATGGALGSLLGQLMHVTADERKTLLAAGATAGMAATFGTPVAAVLLAVELLLFEFRARSIIPVALAACAATAVRLVLLGGAPVFPMPQVSEPTGTALACYAALGGLVGLVAVGISRALYLVEDFYERIPIHWMWWPMLGAAVVGVLGLVEPRILGIGVYNILDALAGRLALGTLAVLVVLKFIAWVGYLGSGTSGGTLAPLFTFGSGIGAIAGALLAARFPALGISPPVAALVGMAAMFAGASRALLTSVVFAFETTRQPLGLLPLLAGCTSAALISRIFNRYTIMTEKLARRGVIVPDEYETDYLTRVTVGSAMSHPVITLDASRGVETLLAALDSDERSHHQGFPVVDTTGDLLGVITRRDLIGVSGDLPLRALIHRPPIIVAPGQSLREAADIMVREGVGRLPVVDPAAPSRVVGILTRSDLLYAHAPRLRAAEDRQPALSVEHLARNFFRG